MFISISIHFHVLHYYHNTWFLTRAFVSTNIKIYLGQVFLHFWMPLFKFKCFPFDNSANKNCLIDRIYTSRSLGWEDPLEKGKATHSSILAWRVQSMGVTKNRTLLSNFRFHSHFFPSLKCLILLSFALPIIFKILSLYLLYFFTESDVFLSLSVCSEGFIF